jgi:hypothetical protein
MVSRFNQNMSRTMTEDQFCQVVEAILNGKYSWACLLILQFAGYNPLHYIPYRTYNRLMKENNRSQRSKQHQPKGVEPDKAPGDPSLKMDNLPYMHNLKETTHIEGGFRAESLYSTFIKTR